MKERVVVIAFLILSGMAGVDPSIHEHGPNCNMHVAVWGKALAALSRRQAIVSFKIQLEYLQGEE